MDGKLNEVLDFYAEKYNHPSFIENDPISIPHQFTKLQDIEIIGFWTAVLSWGQRKTIINKANLLVEMMDGSPYDFMLHHQPSDLKPFLDFKHRTFQADDALYFIQFFQHYYSNNKTLESAFIDKEFPNDLEMGLIHFEQQFFSLTDHLQRTKKHIATPGRKSTCKRICMFLRWMVREDNKGVDFGLWKRIRPEQLYCPFDVHVERIARRFNLVSRKQRDWQTVKDLSSRLKELDPIDPVRYDFALFGMGLEWRKGKLEIDLEGN